jgi:molybdate transport system substrate-binding protein
MLIALACRSVAPPPNDTVKIFAASSLTEGFGDLEVVFEAAHPGVQVQSSFAGSQLLRTQIEQGAQVDVFASADETHLQSLVAAKLAAAPVLFAKNELVLIVPENNPAQLASFADLPRASKVVLGAANVPVGAYTRQLLNNAALKFGASFARDVLAHVVSEESNVRLVRSKVELGEVDAAIVYRTDAMASGRIKSFDIPKDINPLANYYAGAMTASKSRATAQWMEFLKSAEGQSILTRRGFIGVAP